MILDSFRLDGKVAVVTGARKGLGFGIAEGLAEAGADIVGVGPIPMPETEKAVTSLGRKFLYVEADLTSRRGFRTSWRRPWPASGRWTSW